MKLQHFQWAIRSCNSCFLLWFLVCSWFCFFLIHLDGISTDSPLRSWSHGGWISRPGGSTAAQFEAREPVWAVWWWDRCLSEDTKIEDVWRCCLQKFPTCQVRVSRIIRVAFSSSSSSFSSRTAGPQPRAPELSGHCWASTAGHCRTSARRQRECQNRCQIEGQKECQKECQNMNRCQTRCQIE